MKKHRNLLIVLRLVRPLLHMIFILIAFNLIYKLRFYTDLIPFVHLRVPPIDFYETFIFSFLAGGVFLVIGLILGVYELFKPIHGYYTKFLKSWFIWLAIISFIAFFGDGFVFKNGISRFILLWGSILSLVSITVGDFVFNLLNSYIEKRNPYRLLFIYSEKDFFDKIIENYSNYKIYDIKGVNINDIGDKLFDYVKKYDVIATVGNLSKDLLQDMVDIVRLQGKDFYNISESYFLEDLIYRPERLGPIMVFEYKPSPLDGWYRVIKRLFDIVFALVLLVILWPVFVIVSVMIKLDSKGPVFYVQKRVGRNGILFNFIKFRSMYADMCLGDEYGGSQAQKVYEDLINSDLNKRQGPLAKIQGDPRVTKIGKILRKTSLDELPQLISILNGDMSFVGPRPHMPMEVDKYEKWHKRLFSVKPGITGYAQVFGRDKLSFDEEAKLDLYYIQNWNLFLDIYVLISTVRVVLGGK